MTDRNDTRREADAQICECDLSKCDMYCKCGCHSGWAKANTSQTTLTPQREAELSRGTFECDICGQCVPHHHDEELVEIERFIRPAFEKTTVPRNAFGRIGGKFGLLPYSDGGTEQLWQHFIGGWFAAKKHLANLTDSI